jgi:hypothetical protein
MATYKENITLSQIAYVNFSDNEKGMTIGQLLAKEDSSLSKWLNKDENMIWKNNLGAMSDYKLKAY